MRSIRLWYQVVLIQPRRQGVSGVVGVPAGQDGGWDQFSAGLLIPDATSRDGADRIKRPANVSLPVVAGVVADGGDVDASGLQGGLGGGFVGEAQVVGGHDGRVMLGSELSD